MTFAFSFEKKNMYKDTGESIVMVSQNILYAKFPRINTSKFFISNYELSHFNFTTIGMRLILRSFLRLKLLN